MHPPSPDTGRLSVSPFRPGDAESLTELVVAELGQDRAFDARERQANGGEIWVARQVDGSLAGTVSALDLGDDVVVLRDLAVVADHRGTDLSARLVIALVEWCESFGIHEVAVGVPPDHQAAIRFFGKCGFVERAQSVDDALSASLPAGAAVYLRKLRSSPTNPETVPFDMMEWIEVQPGMREKVSARGIGTSRLIEIDSRLDPEHLFTQGRRGYVLSGFVTFVFPTHSSTVEPGQGFVIEAGRVHTAKVEGGGSALLFQVDELSK